MNIGNLLLRSIIFGLLEEISHYGSVYNAVLIMILSDLIMKLDSLTTLMIVGVMEMRLVCHFSPQKILGILTMMRFRLMKQVNTFGCGFLKHHLTKQSRNMLFVQEIISQDGII